MLQQVWERWLSCCADHCFERQRLGSRVSLPSFPSCCEQSRTNVAFTSHKHELYLLEQEFNKTAHLVDSFVNQVYHLNLVVGESNGSEMLPPLLLLLPLLSLGLVVSPCISHLNGMHIVKTMLHVGRFIWWFRRRSIELFFEVSIS